MTYAILKTILELEESGILVCEQPLQNNPCVSIESGRIVGCNSAKFETSAEKRTALLHEHGHFKSGAFYKAYSNHVIKEQAEYRANKAAIMTHIPNEEIKACFAAGITEPWALAEHFDVTEEFMLKAVLYYQELELGKL